MHISDAKIHLLSLVAGLAILGSAKDVKFNVCEGNTCTGLCLPEVYGLDECVLDHIAFTQVEDDLEIKVFADAGCKSSFFIGATLPVNKCYAHPTLPVSIDITVQASNAKTLANNNLNRTALFKKFIGLDMNAAQNTSGEELIVGGNTVVDQHKYPEYVGLADRGKPEKGYFCAGVLIKAEWVLTAAHCVAYERLIDAVVGAYDQQGTIGTRVQVHKPPITHPDFNHGSFKFDFALIQIDAVSTMPAIVYKGGKFDDVTPIGLGTLASGGSRAEKLQEVALKNLQTPEGKCGKYTSFFPEMMICAGVVGGGKDACQGDSGGPMYLGNLVGEDSSRKQHVVLGVTSWGTGCAKADYPGVWARVSAVYDWIESHTGPLDTN